MWIIIIMLSPKGDINVKGAIGALNRGGSLWETREGFLEELTLE